MNSYRYEDSPRRRLKYSGYRKSPAISRTQCTVTGCLPMRCTKKKKRGVIPRAHLAESRSRARPIFLQRPRLTYMPVFPMHAPDTPQCRTCCTPYHYSTLIRTWPFVSYGDARPDTGNIRLFDGGGKNARGRPLYTCYEWSSFRRGQATWNLNYFFSQPSIITSFLSLRT